MIPLQRPLLNFFNKAKCEMLQRFVVIDTKVGFVYHKNNSIPSLAKSLKTTLLKVQSIWINSIVRN